MSTGLWEGVRVRHRLGGRDGMGSGVKVRAELDRVSGVALRPDPIRSTMLGRLPAFSSAERCPFGSCWWWLCLVRIGCVVRAGRGR